MRLTVHSAYDGCGAFICHGEAMRFDQLGGGACFFFFYRPRLASEPYDRISKDDERLHLYQAGGLKDLHAVPLQNRSVLLLLVFQGRSTGIGTAAGVVLYWHFRVLFRVLCATRMKSGDRYRAVARHAPNDWLVGRRAESLSRGTSFAA